MVAVAPLDEKICVDCGRDVSHRSREKFANGDYVCRDCAARERDRRRRRVTLRRVVRIGIGVAVFFGVMSLMVLTCSGSFDSM